MLRRRLHAPRDGGSGPRIFESEQARDGAASRGWVVVVVVLTSYFRIRLTLMFWQVVRVRRRGQGGKW